MRRNVSSALAVGSLVALVAASFACSDDRGTFDNGPENFGKPDSGVCASSVRCSRDLRSIVDGCDETRIIKECPPDQGCAEDECVPACDATVANTSSAGCEFATVPPSRYQGNEGSCFAATITNTWATPARIDAEYDGKALDVATATRVLRASGDGSTYEAFSGELQPGDVAVVFLSHLPERPPDATLWIPCPEGITPAVLADTNPNGTERTRSFRIKTSAPVNTYSIYPFSGAKSYAPSATMVLPISAWKNDYILTSAWTRSLGLPAAPTMQIVAADDGTEVTLLPNTTIAGGRGVDPIEKDVAHTYRLGRGEALQFQQGTELTGSRLSSNKPVGIFSGHQCMLIPSGQMACDTTQLQLFPIQSWGHQYAAVPHLTRHEDGTPEEYFYRITAAANGTVLTYEPARPDDAPETLEGAGSARFTTKQPFIVRSQDKEHPIAVYSYMSGLEFAGAFEDDGDPEFTYVIPTEQYLGHYVFYTDPTFRNTHLVVVRSRPSDKEFQPVVLDCAGFLDGWQPLGKDGLYEYTRVSLRKMSVDQQIGGGTCTPGRHDIDSAGPFTVTVWGTDYAASYAYPGGVAVRKLNEVPAIVR